MERCGIATIFQGPLCYVARFRNAPGGGSCKCLTQSGRGQVVNDRSGVHGVYLTQTLAPASLRLSTGNRE
jgi:hypothetical protein